MLKSQIKQHLKDCYPGVVHKGELGKIAVNDWGRENENMGRRCRELENEGEIIRVLNRKREAQYQHHGTDFDLNTQLRALLERIQKGNYDLWEYNGVIREISGAVKSENEYYKKGIIHKYKHL